jgi:hypothetical protein
MSHLSHAHDSPYKIDRGRTTETSQIQIQTEASQLLITYETKVLTTWFLTDLHLNQHGATYLGTQRIGENPERFPLDQIGGNVGRQMLCHLGKGSTSTGSWQF